MGIVQEKNKAVFAHVHVFGLDFSLVIEKDITSADKWLETKTMWTSLTWKTHKRSESIREVEEVFSRVLLHNLACFYMLYFDIHCALDDYYPVLNFNFMPNTLHLELNVWASEILTNPLWFAQIQSKAVSLLPSPILQCVRKHHLFYSFGGKLSSFSKKQLVYLGRKTGTQPLCQLWLGNSGCPPSFDSRLFPKLQ